MNVPASTNLFGRTDHGYYSSFNNSYQKSIFSQSNGASFSGLNSFSPKPPCGNNGLSFPGLTNPPIKPNKPSDECDKFELPYQAHGHSEYGLEVCTPDSHCPPEIILPEPKLKPGCCYIFKFDALKKKICILEKNIQEISCKKEKAEQNRSCFEHEYTMIVLCLEETKKEKAALECQLKEIECKLKKAKETLREKECKKSCIFGKLACANKIFENEKTNLDIHRYQMKATKNEFALLCYQHKDVCRKCNVCC